MALSIQMVQKRENQRGEFAKGGLSLRREGGMLCQVFHHVGGMPWHKVLAAPGDLIDERVSLEVKMHLELRLPVPVRSSCSGD